MLKMLIQLFCMWLVMNTAIADDSKIQYDLTDKEISKIKLFPTAMAKASSAKSSSNHVGSSPYKPPEGNDRLFVVDTGNKLDTGCIYRSSGPITFTFNVNRVVVKDKIKSRWNIKRRLC